jgi:uncharacterized protein (TIGR03067 family)
MPVLCLLPYLAFLSGCSESGGGGKKNSAYPLAGTTWSVEEHFYNGEGGKPEQPEKVIFRDDFNQVNLPDYMGNYTTSTTGSPKTMTVTIVSASARGEIINCIWEREGDTLKLAYAGKGNRPKDFTPRPGDVTTILTLTRVK